MTEFYMFLVIIFEIVATTSPKMTQEFTVLKPSLFVILFYAFSHYFFSKVVLKMNLGSGKELEQSK
ncbi:quaternary ammonium compound-resistance protein [Streptococcus merionis]|uniref:Quaternary ammonium compound-resistance protein n=2 Tax=Streptococcus merionis TaxID=400065 RepID=A0A239SQE7_9STRE|nr:quaternary ammonium compound-resistance protein [Streptococcus merionis]